MERMKLSKASETGPATLSNHEGFILKDHVAYQNFTGARGLLAVSYLMTKRGLFPVVVFFSLCFSLAAEQASGSPSGHGGGKQCFGSSPTDSVQQLGQSRIRASVFKSRRLFFSDHF